MKQTTALVVALAGMASAHRGHASYETPSSYSTYTTSAYDDVYPDCDDDHDDYPTSAYDYESTEPYTTSTDYATSSSDYTSPYYYSSSEYSSPYYSKSKSYYSSSSYYSSPSSYYSSSSPYYPPPTYTSSMTTYVTPISGGGSDTSTDIYGGGIDSSTTSTPEVPATSIAQSGATSLRGNAAYYVALALVGGAARVLLAATT